GFRLENDAAPPQLVQQLRQHQSGNVHQEIEILRETWATAKTRGHAANEGIADVKLLEGLRELQQARQKILGQIDFISGHDGQIVPSECAATLVRVLLAGAGPLPAEVKANVPAAPSPRQANQIRQAGDRAATTGGMPRPLGR